MRRLDHGLTGVKMKSDLLRSTQMWSEFSLPGSADAWGKHVLVEMGRDCTAANPSYPDLRDGANSTYLDLSRLAFVNENC